MIVSNKFLLNSNLYRGMYIIKNKKELLVELYGNVFDRDENEFDKLAKEFFNKPERDIIEEIQSKSEVEQVDELVSYYARNNKIQEIIGMGRLKIIGDSQILSLKVGSGFKESFRKIAKKYSEDRIRFYGSNSDCSNYLIDLNISTTSYKKDNDNITFNLKRDDDKKDNHLHLVPIDEKFLNIFVREQVINRDGEVILEEKGYYKVLSIGGVTITYDEELDEVFRIALMKRENRIFEEKRMQYKLDI